MSGGAAVVQVLKLAREFDAVHFRWLPRNKTWRARWLAARASGVTARRRERARLAEIEASFELASLAHDEFASFACDDAIDGDVPF
jgi:hypothetical protein